MSSPHDEAVTALKCTSVKMLPLLAKRQILYTVIRRAHYRSLRRHRLDAMPVRHRVKVQCFASTKQAEDVLEMP